MVIDVDLDTLDFGTFHGWLDEEHASSLDVGDEVVARADGFEEWVRVIELDRASGQVVVSLLT